MYLIVTRSFPPEIGGMQNLMWGLTKSLAKELAPDVRVNAISPGAITWPQDMDNKTKEIIKDQIILKKLGEKKDIANCVIFLVSDADYVTGQILNVDGGKTLFL